MITSRLTSLALSLGWQRAAVFAVLVLGLTFSWHSSLKQPAPRTPSSAQLLHINQPLAPQSPPADDAPDTAPPQEVRFSVSGDVWRFVVTWIPNTEVAENQLCVYRNGHLIRRMRASEVGALGLEVRRTVLPSGGMVVGVLSYPGAGHATNKHFFTVRGQRLVYMGKVGGENGGPLFRDEDGDGQTEWVFDNYCWYEQYEKGPNQYLVFKLTKAGTLRLWKRLPNPKHRRLPDRFDFQNG
jgi:hypothetical protein